MRSWCVLTMGLVSGGAYAWSYSNSTKFCGTTCHTMPPENAVYVRSPHANVTCEECHIGRASIFEQLPRKAQGIKETYDTIFNLYQLPDPRAGIAAGARDLREVPSARRLSRMTACEIWCTSPRTQQNTATTTYLIMKTGGGAKREGLGRGIHWHIVNKVEYVRHR